MEYIRKFDEALAKDTGFPGYRAQMVSYQESALVIASWIEHEGCGPYLHYHDSDQSYFLARGTMNVQLGNDVHQIAAPAFVHIPAGLAHRNWNNSGAQEFHFELIVPTPQPGASLLYLVDKVEDAPGSEVPGRAHTIQDSDFHAQPDAAGIDRVVLNDTERSMIELIRLDPAVAGVVIDDCREDTYIAVVQGALGVAASAGPQARIDTHSLAIAPAGASLMLTPVGRDITLFLKLSAPGSTT